MKIPLTIQHKPEDEYLFKMPEAQLLGLIKLDFDKLLETQLRVTNDWVENKRCKCSKSIHIQNKEMALKCNHIKEVKDKETKELRDRMEVKTSALGLRRFLLYKINKHSHKN